MSYKVKKNGNLKNVHELYKKSSNLFDMHYDVAYSGSYPNIVEVTGGKSTEWINTSIFGQHFYFVWNVNALTASCVMGLVYSNNKNEILYRDGLVNSSVIPSTNVDYPAGGGNPYKINHSYSYVKFYVLNWNYTNRLAVYTTNISTFIPHIQYIGEIYQKNPNACQVLPNAYQEVEYLESSGTQYIDTGYTQLSDITETCIEFYGRPNNAKTIFGTQAGGSSTTYNVVYTTSSSTVLFLGSGQVTSASKTFLENEWNKYTLKTSSSTAGSVKLNNDSETSFTYSGGVNKSSSIYLFANQTNGGVTQQVSGKVKSFSIKDNNVLVRNFIPCYRKSDSLAGMYDLVNSVFYTNTGTGVFAVGNDIPKLLHSFSAGWDKTVKTSSNIIKTVVTREKSLKNYKIKGSTYQDISPTPTNPIDICGVGNNTKNLLDPATFTAPTYTVVYHPIAVENGTYTMSSPDMPVYTGVTNVFFLPGNVSTGGSSTVNGVDKDTPRTITVTDGYYTVAERYNSTNPYHPTDYHWQIEEGSTATSYEPYGYEIPILSAGKNMIDIAESTMTSSYTFKTLTSEEVAKWSGKPLTLSCYVDRIVSSTASSWAVYVMTGQGNYIGNWLQITGGRTSVTFNLPSNSTNVRFVCNRAGSGVSSGHIYNVQLEEGSSATTYEPYVTPVVNKIYLSSQLHGGYNNFFDELNKSTGKITRNIGVITFNGSENSWSKHSSGRIFYIPVNGSKVTGITGSNDYAPYCTHFKGETPTNGWYNITNGSCSTHNYDNQKNLIAFRNDSCADVNAWKTWLASNPIKVYYLLATATEETASNLPTVSTVKGTNIFELQTDIFATQFDVTYVAKHNNDICMISGVIDHGSVVNGTTTAPGGSGSLTITPNTGYSLPATVTATGCTCSYNSTSGACSLTNVADEAVVKAACPIITYTITTSVTNGAYSGDTTINYGGNASVTITSNEGYNKPSSVTVSGATYSYNSSTGVITLSNPTGNVTISASCSIIRYYISASVTNGSYTGDNTIAYRGSASGAIVPSTGYVRPSTISVSGSNYNYNYSSGLVYMTNPNSSVWITAVCTLITYTITTSVTNGAYSGDTTINYGGTASVTITANDGYALPDSVTVSGATYSYDSSTGIISLSNPTGNVTISAECPSAVVMPYLTFTNASDEANSSNYISLTNSGIPAAYLPTLQYCVNNGEWTNYTIGQQIVATSFGDVVKFKGTNNKFSDTSYQLSFSCSGPWKVKGNVMSLLDETCESVTIPTSGCFAYLFSSMGANFRNDDDENMPLTLPAETLNTYCYEYMFYGCTNLTVAPELPASTLTNYCYRGMFKGCTSLSSTAVWSAMTLGKGSFSYMFDGCTNLTSSDTLTIRTLTEECYEYMFRDCTSLTNKPRLPATTMAKRCYRGMFKGCTSLTSCGISMSALTLAELCWAEMYSGCISLTSLSPIMARAYEPYCCYLMFEGCTGLTNIPANTIIAVNRANYCFYNMFKDCTNITTVYSDTLWGPNLATGCCRGTFEGCTSLTTAPVLPILTLADECYRDLFKGCTSLTTAPSLPATTLAKSCYNGMFSGCTSLTTIPELPCSTFDNTCTNCYGWMFYNCSNIKISQTMTTDYLETYTFGATCGGTYASSMFTGTGGTYTGQPSSLIYYTNNTIATSKTKYTVTTSVTNGTYLSATSIITGLTAKAKITANAGYALPDAITVTGATYTYDSVTGNIDLNNPTDNVTISAACRELLGYPITTNVTNGSHTGDNAIEEGSTASVTIVPISGTSVLPLTITVTGADYTYNSTTGIINLSNPTGSVTITAACDIITTYTVIGNVTNGSLQGPKWIQTRGTQTLGLDANMSYHLPLHITVVGASYTYNHYDGTIELSNPTGEVTVTAECTAYAQPDYLSVTAVGGTDAVIKFVKRGSWSGLTLPSIIYTTGDISEWDSVNYGTSITIPAGETYLFSGSDNEYVCASTTNYINFTCTSGYVDIGGDIMTLLNEDESSWYAPDYCFVRFFQSCTRILHVSKNLLHTKDIGEYTYVSMFYGCTGLVNAPSLPAEYTYTGCYYRMFYGCTNLEEIPVLGCTQLEYSCYKEMFYNCSKIKISEIQTGDYVNTYTFGTTPDVENDTTLDMFTGTGGTFTETPTAQTYYTSNTIIS